jgi:hypothetical protein
MLDRYTLPVNFSFQRPEMFGEFADYEYCGQMITKLLIGIVYQQ